MTDIKPKRIMNENQKRGLEIGRQITLEKNRRNTLEKNRQKDIDDIERKERIEARILKKGWGIRRRQINEDKLLDLVEGEWDSSNPKMEEPEKEEPQYKHLCNPFERKTISYDGKFTFC